MVGIWGQVRGMRSADENGKGRDSISAALGTAAHGCLCPLTLIPQPAGLSGQRWGICRSGGAARSKLTL